MLKLKDEIDLNNKLTIFIHKSRGRKLVFDPKEVSETDYPKYKALGFNIFRCKSCGTDTCFGDCNIQKFELELIQTEPEVIQTEPIQKEPEAIQTEPEAKIKEKDSKNLDEVPPVKKKKGRPKKQN